LPLSDEQDRALHIYHGLMEEAKIRIDVVIKAMSGKSDLSKWAAMELCFLQLRMLCEVIALGCLTLHGDMAETHSNKFMKESSADKIMHLLHMLHDKFYPIPCQPKYDENGKVTMFVAAPADLVFLTRGDLDKLYARCNTVLHRTPLKKLLEASSPFQAEFVEVQGWLQKIDNLLSLHGIAARGLKKMVVINLRDLRNHGRVQILPLEAIENPPSTNPRESGP
jgi:hypothetical protein